MTDIDSDKIVENTKRKYFPTLSTTIFHSGVIVLLSIATGLICFQFYQLPTDISPEEISMLRSWNCLLFMFCGVAAYLLWTLWRAYLFKREAQEKIIKSALDSLKK